MIQQYGFLVLTCFGADLDRVSHAALEALAARDLRHRFAVTRADANPRDIYSDAPTPGGSHSKYALFFEPASRPGTTALFVNLEDGWWTLVNAIVARVDGAHAQIRITTQDAEYPIHSIEIWADGVSRRIVSCLRDDMGKWIYTSLGTPLEFENQVTYASRRISDRLSQEQITDYMRALGWDIIIPQFWRSDRLGVYLREIGTQA